jgi:hypothetical protein
MITGFDHFIVLVNDLDAAIATIAVNSSQPSSRPNVKRSG